MNHDECPRINWKLPVVEDLTIGNNGMICSAKIRAKNGVINRPVTKLYPLEVTAGEAGTIRDQLTDRQDDNSKGDNTVSESGDIHGCY